LEPVIASTRGVARPFAIATAGSACANNSTSPTTGTPRRSASATSGSRLSTPGLIAITSAASKTARS
jgi:hypothetical protein